MAEVITDEYGNQYYDPAGYTPDYLNSLEAPCEAFLLPLNYNVYNIQFVDFKIRSLDEGKERPQDKVVSNNSREPKQKSEGRLGGPGKGKRSLDPNSCFEVL